MKKLLLLLLLTATTLYGAEGWLIQTKISDAAPDSLVSSLNTATGAPHLVAGANRTINDLWNYMVATNQTAMVP